MSSNMPARVTTPIMVGRKATRRELQVVAARREVEQGLLTVSLQQHFLKEAAIIEASSAAEATKHCIGVELDVLADGIERAGSSAAAAKLVGDKLEFLSRTTSSILNRRFGS